VCILDFIGTYYTYVLVLTWICVLQLSRALREEETQVRAVAGSLPRIGKDKDSKSPKGSPKGTSAAAASTTHEH
jgi:hypothetical protein